MNQLKKAFHIGRDIVEIYLPSVMFFALFVAFIMQIVSRYLFHNPLVWPYELAQISYVWVILLGACYAGRKKTHIVFSVLYESAPAAVCKACDILSHLLTIVLLSYIVPSLITFYRFYFTRYSAVFKVPLGLVYFGFFPFVVITVLRSAFRLVEDVRKPLTAYRREPAGEEEAV